MAFYSRRTLLVLTIFLSYCFKETVSISCFNCSSVNDNFCPELMNYGDEDVVPYVSCDNVHDAGYCVKTIGVNGGSLAIKCYRCDDSVQMGCSDDLFNAPLSDCKDIFDAYYCIKTIGVYGGSLGTTRFCSSRDMGNYCEYIRRPGDQLEYRSCVHTCSSDGCNAGSRQGPSRIVVLTYAISCLTSWFLFTNLFQGSS